MSALRLLFVCTGNICRSPMAEGLSLKIGHEFGRDVAARSASVIGLIDRPADPKAVKVCREIGVDLSAHVAQPLSPDLIAWADYVLVMELGHAEQIRETYPEVGEQLYLLGTFGGTLEIKDPYGGWTWTFRRSRKEIELCVREFLRRVA